MFTIGAIIAILAWITGALRDRPHYDETWVDTIVVYVWSFGVFLMLLSLLVLSWNKLP